MFKKLNYFILQKSSPKNVSVKDGRRVKTKESKKLYIPRVMQTN